MKVNDLLVPFILGAAAIIIALYISVHNARNVQQCIIVKLEAVDAPITDIVDTMPGGEVLFNTNSIATEQEG